MNRSDTLLWTTVIVPVPVGLLGTITSYTMSGSTHILQVVARIVAIVRAIQG